MAKVDNSNERVLGANNLVVTSYIDEEVYYKITVKYYNRSYQSVSVPRDTYTKVNGRFVLDIKRVSDLTSFYTTNSVEGNDSANPDDYEGLIQSTKIDITPTKDTVINVLYFYIV